MAEDTSSVPPEERQARANAFLQQLRGDPEKKKTVEELLGHGIDETPNTTIQEPLDYSHLTEENARIWVDYKDQEKKAGRKPLEFEEFTKSQAGKEYAKKWKAAQVLGVSL